MRFWTSALNFFKQLEFEFDYSVYLSVPYEYKLFLQNNYVVIEWYALAEWKKSNYQNYFVTTFVTQNTQSGTGN